MSPSVSPSPGVSSEDETAPEDDRSGDARESEPDSGSALGVFGAFGSRLPDLVIGSSSSSEYCDSGTVNRGKQGKTGVKLGKIGENLVR